MGSGQTKQPFALPELGYAYGALEPHIDAQTMEIHYSKHHAAYINNANKALAGHPALLEMSGEEILANLAAIDAGIRQALRNNVGGHVNHSFFWNILSPKGGGVPVGELGEAIAKQFGSFDALKGKVSDTAKKHFGSGWAWLSVHAGTLEVHTTANQDSPISNGAVPVIGIDVWEHAYYLKHQNVRADYVDAFWNVVNWEQANANFKAARAAS